MKHRAGFVTNSSSSSFVLAVRVGAEEKDIRAAVELRELEIQSIVSEYANYCDEKDITLEQAKIDLVARILAIANNSPRLDNWNVCAMDVSNEGDVVDMIFYELSGLDSDAVKML